MTKVSVSQMRLNTYYTSPVFLDGRYIILYPNLPVTADLLKRLREWHFKEVETNGLPSESIPSLKMNPLVDTVSQPSGKSAVTIESEKLLQFENTLARIYDICRNTEKIDCNAFFEFAKSFRSTVNENLPGYLSVTDSGRQNDYLIVQSVRTAVLAFAVSETLKIPLYRQLELISAALLHKIGMIKIPKEIYLKKEALQPKELELVRYYPVLGARLLKSNGFSNEVVQGVLEHQESYDGSGYPQQLAGENICLFGRILNISTSYCAMTAVRPYKHDCKKESCGVIEILQNAKKNYDPNLCRSLVMLLSLYPVGTMVLMQNHSTGIVIKTNPNDPKAPAVKLLTDSTMKPMMNERIVDTRSSEFRIVRTLTDDEILNVKNLFHKR